MRKFVNVLVVSLTVLALFVGTAPIPSSAACHREGIVSRNAGCFAVDDFDRNVFKYVRKGHVKTDEHWTRNWRRARLCWEYPVK